jgi:hypothetical protein
MSDTPTTLTALLYFAGAGLITLGIDVLRRWVKHRMDLWEARNPLPKDKQ